MGSAVYPQEGGGVATVTAQTSNALNNSDAANPVIKDASSSNAGTMSAADKTKADQTFPYAQGTDLVSGTQTITPGTDKKSQYVMRNGVMAANSVVTLSTANASQGICVDIDCLDTGIYSLAIKNGAGTTIATIPAGVPMKVELFFNSGQWIFSTQFFL